MAHQHRTFIPAAGLDLLLPLYDPLGKLMGVAAAHRQLVEQAELRPGQRVLEIGCGTGNLTVLIKTLQPAVDVVGIDPDAKALEIARRKAARRGAVVQFDGGFADELPYPSASFDRVFSALMLHHLERDGKERALREVRRVLKSGGSLHLLDFGGAHDGGHGVLKHLFHRAEHLRDNAPETLLGLMRDAGLGDATETGQRRTLFGRVFYFRAA